jgi:thioredoxin reductase (NADPH)
LAVIDHRDEQMFPKLQPEEIDRIRGFGKLRHYAPGEPLFVTGDVAPGLFILVRGTVNVVRRDALGHLSPIVDLKAGDRRCLLRQLENPRKHRNGLRVTLWV